MLMKAAKICLIATVVMSLFFTVFAFVVVVTSYYIQ